MYRETLRQFLELQPTVKIIAGTAVMNDYQMNEFKADNLRMLDLTWVHPFSTVKHHFMYKGADAAFKLLYIKCHGRKAPTCF